MRIDLRVMILTLVLIASVLGRNSVGHIIGEENGLIRVFMMRITLYIILEIK